MPEKKLPSILVIDEDSDFLEVLKLGLKEDFDVHTIENLQSLKRQITEMMPSIILLSSDIGNSKPKDVIDFLNSIKILKNIPVYLFTNDDNEKYLAGELNLKGIIEKPTNFKEIQDKLFSILNPGSKQL